MTRAGERLLHEISYSFLFALFSIVNNFKKYIQILIIWYSIYEELLFEIKDNKK